MDDQKIETMPFFDTDENKVNLKTELELEKGEDIYLPEYKKKGNKMLKIILMVLIGILLVGGIGYVGWRAYNTYLTDTTSDAYLLECTDCNGWSLGENNDLDDSEENVQKEIIESDWENLVLNEVEVKSFLPFLELSDEYSKDLAPDDFGNMFMDEGRLDFSSVGGYIKSFQIRQKLIEWMIDDGGADEGSVSFIEGSPIFIDQIIGFENADVAQGEFNKLVNFIVENTNEISDYKILDNSSIGEDVLWVKDAWFGADWYVFRIKNSISTIFLFPLAEDIISVDVEGLAKLQADKINNYLAGKIFFDENKYMLDTDGDGLPDLQEINYWKTEIDNIDSDGDGYSDGQEVENGYDPLGSEKMSKPF